MEKEEIQGKNIYSIQQVGVQSRINNKGKGIKYYG